MRKSGYLLLLVGISLVIAVLVSIDESEAAPEPKRRSGGSRKSSSSGSSWFGGSKKKNNGYSNTGNSRRKRFLWKLYPKSILNLPGS